MRLCISSSGDLMPLFSFDRSWNGFSSGFSTKQVGNARGEWERLCFLTNTFEILYGAHAHDMSVFGAAMEGIVSRRATW
jgi:hypothetical protein